MAVKLLQGDCRLGRDAILIELSPEYVAMAEKRLRSDAPLFMDVAAQ